MQRGLPDSDRADDNRHARKGQHVAARVGKAGCEVGKEVDGDAGDGAAGDEEGGGLEWRVAKAVDDARAKGGDGAVAELNVSA